MAEFLNTQKLKEYLVKIIETAERELVIISPYIQTSTNLNRFTKKSRRKGCRNYNSLQRARG
jgi:phosphatidylserine/phosphatidylglycerophosphate/cardiolipin synthase-like enzyme